MRLHIIACQVFYRELSLLLAQSDTVSSVTWLPQGLHDTPDLLRRRVEQAIQELYRALEQGELKHRPDAIVLGYGLCSNGIAGLAAGQIPLVACRTDDCIGIFLGAQRRYLDLFHRYDGIYWMNCGWIESAFLPTQENYECRYQEYIRLYGQDNADFLLEQERGWIGNYRYAGYISSPAYQSGAYLGLAREIARQCGWEFRQFEGDLSLMERLILGQWDPAEVLVCPPGHRIEPSFDQRKIKAVPCSGAEPSTP